MTHFNPAALSDDELRQKINMETGRIDWPELKAHLERGAIVSVAPELDLVEVAVAFARDSMPAVETWIKGGQVWRALDDDTQRWEASEASFWAVVVAPWVLVQERPQ